MLRVWSISGQELAAVPPGEMSEGGIHLKRHLRNRYGYPVCLQKLLQAGHCLEDGAPLVGPEDPLDLQLVLLSALSPKQMPQAESEWLEYLVSPVVPFFLFCWFKVPL